MEIKLPDLTRRLDSSLSTHCRRMNLTLDSWEWIVKAGFGTAKADHGNPKSASLILEDSSVTGEASGRRGGEADWRVGSFLRFARMSLSEHLFSLSVLDRETMPGSYGETMLRYRVSLSNEIERAATSMAHSLLEGQTTDMKGVRQLLFFSIERTMRTDGLVPRL